MINNLQAFSFPLSSHSLTFLPPLTYSYFSFSSLLSCSDMCSYFYSCRASYCSCPYSLTSSESWISCASCSCSSVSPVSCLMSGSYSCVSISVSYFCSLTPSLRSPPPRPASAPSPAFSSSRSGLLAPPHATTPPPASEAAPSQLFCPPVANCQHFSLRIKKTYTLNVFLICCSIFFFSLSLIERDSSCKILS